MSVKDGLEIEYMAIDELNEYIDKNINKMEKLNRLSQDIVSYEREGRSFNIYGYEESFKYFYKSTKLFK